MPEFAVIIPTFNSAVTLERLLESLEQQTDRDFETIVVDDGSTDNTPEVVERFDVGYVRLESNAGPAAARNRGAKSAAAPWLIFADADTEFRPDTIASIRGKLAESDADALVGSYSRQPANEGFVPRFKALWEYATIDLGLTPDARGLAALGTWAPRPGVVRKTAFEAVKGFDARFTGADLEDMEFGYRLSEAGYRIYFAPDVRISHNYPESVRRELRAFARRSALWMRMLRSRRQLDTTGEGSGESALAHLVGFAAFACLLVAAVRPLAWPVYGMLMALYAWLNRRFLALALRDAGLIFTIRSFLYCWVHTIVLGFAAAYGLLTPFRAK